jgi:hypothetical protein
MASFNQCLDAHFGNVGQAMSGNRSRDNHSDVVEHELPLHTHM